MWWSRRSSPRASESDSDKESGLAKVVDYFFTPVSPHLYLGRERFVDLAEKHGANIAGNQSISAKCFRSRAGSLSASVLAGGWYHSGDLGVWHADNYIEISAAEDAPDGRAAALGAVSWEADEHAAQIFSSERRSGGRVCSGCRAEPVAGACFDWRDRPRHMGAGAQRAELNALTKIADECGVQLRGACRACANARNHQSLRCVDRGGLRPLGIRGADVHLSRRNVLKPGPARLSSACTGTIACFRTGRTARRKQQQSGAGSA